MRKRRKDYRVEVGPEPLTGMPGSLLVNFLHDTGDLAQTFDFSAYSAPSRMAAEITLAFRHHHATSAASTRYNTFRNVGIWFQFLDAHDRAVASMKEVDEAVLRAFIAWLDRQLHSKGARYVVWSSVKQLFAWLLRHRPELMHPGSNSPSIRSPERMLRPNRGMRSSNPRSRRCWRPRGPISRRAGRSSPKASARSPPSTGPQSRASLTWVVST